MTVGRIAPEIECELLLGDLAVVLSTRPAPAMDAAAQTRVDQLWREERQRHPGRHDGQLLSLVARSGNRLEGRFVPYRHYIACRLDPSLRPVLAVVPLAVSGLLLCAGQVAFARRGLATTQYPGWLELVPSGGIESASLQADGTVDHRGQLLRELEEEAGVPPEEVRSVKPIALLHDRTEPLVDIASLIEVSEAARARMERVIPSGERPGAEYRSLVFVPVADLAAFLEREGTELIPASRALCRAFLSGLRSGRLY